jgi:hypothetical protein
MDVASRRSFQHKSPSLQHHPLFCYLRPSITPTACYIILQTTSDSEIIFRYLRVFIPSNHDIFDVNARRVVKSNEFFEKLQICIVVL